jgi:hypothetical protein
MKALFIATAALAVIGVPPPIAQSRTLTVCEALNSAKDHQTFTIRARIAGPPTARGFMSSPIAALRPGFRDVDLLEPQKELL